MPTKELREIENEAWEQQEKGENIEEEAKAHKERADLLEQAIWELQTTQDELHSQQTEQAIHAAQEAKQATETRLEELRQEKEDLLAENKEMAEQVQEAQQKRQKAMETVSLAADLSDSAQSEIRTEVTTMLDAVEEDLKRLEATDVSLEAARQKLESLDL